MNISEHEKQYKKRIYSYMLLVAIFVPLAALCCITGVSLWADGAIAEVFPPEPTPRPTLKPTRKAISIVEFGDRDQAHNPKLPADIANDGLKIKQATIRYRSEYDRYQVDVLVENTRDKGDFFRIHNFYLSDTKDRQYTYDIDIPGAASGLQMFNPGIEYRLTLSYQLPPGPGPLTLNYLGVRLPLGDPAQ